MYSCIIGFLASAKAALTCSWSRQTKIFFDPLPTSGLTTTGKSIISSYFETAVSTDQNICVNNRKEFLPRISVGPNISISDFKSKIIGTEFLLKKFFNKQ